MPLHTNKNLKLYYSIKEVAAMFEINESTLRFWETEFPHLRPKVQKDSKARQYTDKDIEQIKLIYNLVKVAAARKVLNDNREGVDKTADVMETLISVRDRLRQMKKQLDGLV